MCGTVRFRLASAPFDAGWCHCRTCQLNSGAPAMAFASVKAGDFGSKRTPGFGALMRNLRGMIARRAAGGADAAVPVGLPEA